MQKKSKIESGMNIKRGLKKAAIFALIGYFAAVIGVFIMVPMMEPDRFPLGKTPTGFGDGRYAFDRFLNCISGDCLLSNDITAITGIVSLLACTGWTTFAPNGKYNFTLTLAIIAFLEIPVWIISFILSHYTLEILDKTNIHLNWLNINLQRQLLAFISPVFVSVIMTYFRSKKQVNLQNSNSENN